jgi:hypothetical protein
VAPGPRGDEAAGARGSGESASADDAITGKLGKPAPGAVQVAGESAGFLLAEAGDLGEGGGDVAGAGDAPSPLQAEADGVVQGPGAGRGLGTPGGWR